MAETNQIQLDEFQLVDLAKMMAGQTDKICKIKHPDAWKMLLGLYRLQISYSKEKEWPGIQAKALAKSVSVKSNENRYLKGLYNLNLIEVRTDLLTSPPAKKYSLSDEGREFVEEILQKSENMITLFRTEVISGEIPKVVGALDKYNIFVGTLAYLHNFYPEDDKDFPNLFDLAATLDMKPNQIMESIETFCRFDSISSEKESSLFFYIKRGKPRIRRVAFNCNDFFICNCFCLLCHRTEIDLSPLGEEMCKALTKSPQRINYQIRQASVEKFFTVSIIISILFLMLGYAFNNSITEIIIFTFTMILLVNGFSYWVLKGKNKGLLFEENDQGD